MSIAEYHGKSIQSIYKSAKTKNGQYKDYLIFENGQMYLNKTILEKENKKANETIEVKQDNTNNSNVEIVYLKQQLELQKKMYEEKIELINNANKERLADKDNEIKYLRAEIDKEKQIRLIEVKEIKALVSGEDETETINAEDNEEQTETPKKRKKFLGIF